MRAYVTTHRRPLSSRCRAPSQQLHDSCRAAYGRSMSTTAPPLSAPANIHRPVPLTYDEFRFGFANTVSEGEAKVADTALAFLKRFV
jgi:hypothetical protein